MKNSLEDMHNLLMEQLERLNDADLDEENLDREIERSKAMTGVAKVITANANTVLRAAQLKHDIDGTGAVNNYLLKESKHEEK